MANEFNSAVNSSNSNNNSNGEHNVNNSEAKKSSANGPLNKWKNSTKTRAKRMGIKSAFSYGNGSLAVTTFGKGNNAEVILNAPNGGREYPTPSFCDPIRFNSINSEIDVERGELNSILTNPAFNEGASDAIKSDYLKLKAVLEQEFFGAQFPKDTVRIQIIYNLLDILKIIGVYVNDVIYCVNNLQPEPTDVIGLSTSKDNLTKVLAKMSPYFGFFGDAFKVPKKGAKEQEKKEADEYNGYVLRALGAMRQMTAHFRESGVFFAKPDAIEKELKKITNESKNNLLTSWKVVEAAYEKRVKDINENFVKNSGVNLGILFNILGAYYDEEKAEITEEYYRFAILKQGKNLGLNMRKLRETMIDAYCPYIKEKEHDSYRQKLYIVTDYLIYRNLNNTAMLDAMVDQLRMTADDQEKEDLYTQFAEEVWKLLEKQLTEFYGKFKGDFPVFESNVIRPEWLGKAAMGREQRLPFVMLMSFLCNFLEGKEINELLTAFINKFENIQALIETQKELNDKIVFAPQYDAFNKFGSQYAGSVARQLRVIVSVGKMKPDLVGAKRLLYKSAIQTLGIPDNSDYISDKWLEENLLLTQEEKQNKERVKQVNPFRNFVANNVIESRRFLYLVRYTKPETVRAIMTNARLVKYALSRLPESQIKMYYDRTLGAQKDASQKEMLDQLTSAIKGLSFETLLANRAGIITDTTNRPKAIERLKAQIGLYLTVAYWVVKNLVKTNARYYIAFAALERDHEMLKRKDEENYTINHIPFTYTDKNGNEKKDENHYYSLTEYYLDRDDEIKYVPENGVFDKEACHRYFDEHKAHFTRKWRDIFRKEIAEAKQASTTGYLGIFVRNQAEHLNVLTALPKYIDAFRCGSDAPMRSYFELYHYVIQRMALDEKALNLEAYREFIETNGLPDNDLIHISYCHLGYNLPRYKNLTIAALFDADSVDGQLRTKRLAEKNDK